MSKVISKPGLTFTSANGNKYIKVDGEVVMLSPDVIEQWDNIRTVTIDKVTYDKSTVNGVLVDVPMTRLEITDITTRGGILADKKFEVEMEELGRKLLKTTILTPSEVDVLEEAATKG